MPVRVGSFFFNLELYRDISIEAGGAKSGLKGEDYW